MKISERPVTGFQSEPESEVTASIISKGNQNTQTFLAEIEIGNSIAGAGTESDS